MGCSPVGGNAVSSSGGVTANPQQAPAAGGCFRRPPKCFHPGLWKLSSGIGCLHGRTQIDAASYLCYAQQGGPRMKRRTSGGNEAGMPAF